MMRGIVTRVLMIVVAGTLVSGCNGPPGSSLADSSTPKSVIEPRKPTVAQPADAVQAILSAFDHHSIVALGESHGLTQEREFISKLVHDPRFSDKVNDIVVEFGNARYQDVMDRYMAGEHVPPAQLQHVWREHTCPGPQTSSAYPKYFAAFREANLRLPPARRFRVLLGDPPIDWRTIHTWQDLGHYLARRDSHFAQLVEDQVLAKGRKALLIIGSTHLLRQEPLRSAGAPAHVFVSRPAPDKTAKPQNGTFFVGVPSGSPAFGNVAQRVERQHPGKLFIVLPHDGLGQGSADIEKEFFPSWPVPSVALLKGTRLGGVAAHQLLPREQFFKDGKAVAGPTVAPTAGPRLQGVVDALLYLGPAARLSRDPDTDDSHDKAFRAELQRRRQLPGGPPGPPPAGRKESRQYIGR